MPDDEAAVLDPFGEGVPWATKLFGICGISPFEAIRECQTLLVAPSISRLVELRLVLEPSCRSAVQVGGLVVSRRLNDDEVPQPVGWSPTALEIIEIAFLDPNFGSASQALMTLPFKALRVGQGSPGEMGEWQVTDFDWSPELSNLSSQLC